MGTMEQVIPFNQSTAGKVPDECLENVRKGFSIPAKYASAWEAWEHTQQHTDNNLPTGLDIPLYYSYTATIDGVTQNYGHINVRLANGTVWSDGNIYANVGAYLADHSPKFVGWGESVNDTMVIQGVQEMTDSQLYQMFNQRDVYISATNATVATLQKTVQGLNDSVDANMKAITTEFASIQSALNGLSTNIENINQILKSMGK